MPTGTDLMSRAAFHLVYDGPALQANEMLARDLSSALISADDLFVAASGVLNQERSEATLRVKASFRSGSFGIELHSLVGIADQLRDIFSSDTASAICNAQTILVLLFGASGVLPLMKWLRGRKIAHIEHRDGKVRIFIDGEHFDTEQRVLELFRSHKVRQALEDVIAKPLQKEGISGFAIIQNNDVLSSVDESEADYFTVAAVPEEELTETTREVWLNIVSIAFKGGDKWRVNDGGANFYVSISDPDFTLKVLKNEIEFGSFTRMKARIKESQYTDLKGQLHKSTEVLKVLQIYKPDEQLPIPEAPQEP